jgi:hypothetical protein
MRSGYEDRRKDEAFRNPRAKAIAIVWLNHLKTRAFLYNLRNLYGAGLRKFLL